MGAGELGGSLGPRRERRFFYFAPKGVISVILKVMHLGRKGRYVKKNSQK